MKKQKRKTPTIRIKELAELFQDELAKKMPVSVLPDGSAVYQDYVIKQDKRGKWLVHNYKQSSDIDQFFLKSCAIMAAKAYCNTQLSKYFEIKRLDNSYWASHCDTQVYKHNIKNTKEYERYLILLNKLEESTIKEAHYKAEISKMFKWSFV